VQEEGGEEVPAIAEAGEDAHPKFWQNTFPGISDLICYEKLLQV